MIGGFRRGRRGGISWASAMPVVGLYGHWIYGEGYGNDRWTRGG